MKWNKPLPAPTSSPPAEIGNRILQNGEPLIGLAEAGRPTATHVSTVARWIKRGILRDGRRVKLEHVRVGSKLKTSAAAVLRFLAALSEDPETTPPAPTSAERLRSVEAAAKALEAMGA